MSDKIILYRTFYNPIEANIVRSKLEDSGLHCFLTDEYISTIQPLYNQAVGGVKLMVFERDKSEIDLLLSEDDNLQENSGQQFIVDKENDTPISCLKCGCNNVFYGQSTKYSFISWLRIVSVMLFVYPFKVNKCFHCHDCGNEFK